MFFVLVSYCCCNKPHGHRGLKQQESITSHCGGQTSKMARTGWAPSGGSEGKAPAFPFPPAGGCPNSLARGSLLHRQAIRHITLTSASVITSFLTLSPLPSSFTRKAPCDDTGPTWIAPANLRILNPIFKAPFAMAGGVATGSRD